MPTVREVQRELHQLTGEPAIRLERMPAVIGHVREVVFVACMDEQREQLKRIADALEILAHPTKTLSDFVTPAQQAAAAPLDSFVSAGASTSGASTQAAPEPLKIEPPASEPEPPKLELLDTRDALAKDDPLGEDRGDLERPARNRVRLPDGRVLRVHAKALAPRPRGKAPKKAPDWPALISQKYFYAHGRGLCPHCQLRNNILRVDCARAALDKTYVIGVCLHCGGNFGIRRAWTVEDQIDIGAEARVAFNNLLYVLQKLGELDIDAEKAKAAPVVSEKAPAEDLFDAQPDVAPVAASLTTAALRRASILAVANPNLLYADERDVWDAAIRAGSVHPERLEAFRHARMTSPIPRGGQEGITKARVQTLLTGGCADVDLTPDDVVVAAVLRAELSGQPSDSSGKAALASGNGDIPSGKVPVSSGPVRTESEPSVVEAAPAEPAKKRRKTTNPPGDFQIVAQGPISVVETPLVPGIGATAPARLGGRVDDDRAGLEPVAQEALGVSQDAAIAAARASLQGYSDTELIKQWERIYQKPIEKIVKLDMIEDLVRAWAFSGGQPAAAKAPEPVLAVPTDDSSVF